MGWEIRVLQLRRAAQHSALTPAQPLLIARWLVGTQGIRWLGDLCDKGLALRTAGRGAEPERYVLCAAVLRSAIEGNAVFSNAPDAAESDNLNLSVLRPLSPAELVVVEVGKRG
jgi:hypothetical protein